MEQCRKNKYSGAVWKDPLLILFCLFIGVVALLFVYAKSLLILLFITTLLFVLLDPIVKRLTKKMHHTAAVILSILGFIVIAFGMLLRSVTPELTKFAAEFSKFIINFNSDELLSNIPPEMVDYSNGVLKNAEAFVISIIKDSIQPFINTFSGVAEMVAVPFITYYLLKDGRRLGKSICSFLPETTVERIKPFINDVCSVLGGYIRGQIMVAFFSGVSVFTGMWALGLPYVPILALIAALSEFIPVIGSVIATVPSLLISLTLSWGVALKVLIFYLLLLKVNHNIIYPKVVGQAIKVHPIFIIVTVILFGHLFGVIGMLFAVPSVAIFRVLIVHAFGSGRKIIP